MQALHPRTGGLFFRSKLSAVVLRRVVETHWHLGLVIIHSWDGSDADRLTLLLDERGNARGSILGYRLAREQGIGPPIPCSLASLY